MTVKYTVTGFLSITIDNINHLLLVTPEENDLT